MPKVVVYVPAFDAAFLEERHGDLALWVREQLKRAVALEMSRASHEGEGPELPPDAGNREPRRPVRPDRSGTAVVEPELEPEQEAEAVSPDREFKPDFKEKGRGRK